jgi:hypothetical protein
MKKLTRLNLFALILLLSKISSAQLGADIEKVDIHTNREFSYSSYENKIEKFYRFKDTLYAVGKFQQINGIPCNNIAKYDGKKWVQLGDTRENKYAYDIIEYRGELYVSGQWDNAYVVKRWTGKEWKSFGTKSKKDGYSFEAFIISEYNLSIKVLSMAVFNDELYCGGILQPIGSTNASVIKWDGYKWSKLGENREFDLASITSLVVFNNKLYMGAQSPYGFDQENFCPLLEWDGTSLKKIYMQRKMEKRLGDAGVDKLIVFNNEIYISNEYGIMRWDGSENALLYSRGRVENMSIINDHLVFANGSWYNDGNKQVVLIDKSKNLTYIKMIGAKCYHWPPIYSDGKKTFLPYVSKCAL